MQQILLVYNMVQLTKKSKITPKQLKEITSAYSAATFLDEEEKLINIDTKACTNHIYQAIEDLKVGEFIIWVTGRVVTKLIANNYNKNYDEIARLLDN